MARQRLRPDIPTSKEDVKAGQKVFREWCGDNGIFVDVFSGADLCKKISQAIALARTAAQHAEDRGLGHEQRPSKTCGR